MFGRKNSQRERRKRERRAFEHYMQFKNEMTGELVGDLADISLLGFRLEGTKPVAPNTELHFRVDLPPEISDKACIVFTARSRWVQPHQFDPRLYVMGYQIAHMDPADSRLYLDVFERYGSTGQVKPAARDYVWQE